MAVRREAQRRKSSGSSDSGAKSKRAVWLYSWLDEAAALLCFSLAAFVLLSFSSFQLNRYSASGVANYAAQHSSNLMGPAGYKVATLLVGTMGWCALVPALCLLWLAIFLWRYDREEDGSGIGLSWHSPIGFLGVLLFACAAVSVFLGQNGGGRFGVWLSAPLVAWLNTAGAELACLAGLVLSITLTTKLSALDIAKNLGVSVAWLLLLVIRLPILVARAALYLLGVAARLARVSWDAICRSVGSLPKSSPESTLPRPRRHRNELSDEEDEGAVEEDSEDSDQAELDDIGAGEEGGDAEEEDDEEYTHVVVSRRVPKRDESDSRKKPTKAARRLDDEVLIVKDGQYANFIFPGFELLTLGETTPGGEDDSELLEKSKLIEAKLRDFDVHGRVTEVHPGPVITLFEFEPAPGVKVNKVASLADDLAMSLKASSIRVIAPIPKRGTVGIEIPNRMRELVRLRDVLESEAFTKSESVLTVALGKDTYGDPMVVDIAAMPHLLMAGATGTGKSVCINAVLLSLLYHASPAELGLILIDPKMVELSVYEGIPHLLVPVVTHPRQAKAVLQWAIDEMHRRYRLIQRFGVRNIDAYNGIVAGESDDSEKPGAKPTVRTTEDVVFLGDDAVLEEGTVETNQVDQKAQPIVGEQLKPLPKVLIVIDEVADLMLSAGRDVEELITRLAQKGRAAGLHLIIATQRPSVDVVTGLIKANFPARLSFRVSSRVDSRTILDSMGAEKLLGRGDMLFLQPGGEAVKRVHGAYVADGEVKKVVDLVKAQCAPQYDERIMQVCEKALEEADEGKNGGASEGENEYDPVYDKAVELVVEKGHASTSMIQRVFRIGYNRAARIIEVMEREGVVGPMDGAKPREVLVQRSAALDDGNSPVE